MESGRQRKMVETSPPMATQIVLRILGAVASFVAAWIAVTNKQSVFIFGIQFQARYSYTSAFKVLVFANFMSCASSVVSSLVSFLLSRRRHLNYFYLFLHDMVVTTLLIGGCAAASTEGYFGKHGNTHSGWMPICIHVNNFCNRMTVSVILSYLAFALYFTLTILSASAHKSQL